MREAIILGLGPSKNECPYDQEVWGVNDTVVKYASPNFIYVSCPATTNYDFGLKLIVPTSFSDGAVKSNVVRITAVAE